MAAITGITTTMINSRPANSYGLLSNEVTAVMQRETQAGNIPIGEILVVGRKGVFSLNMVYDWWLIYAATRGLIRREGNKDGQWIFPNETLDALLADEYIKYGAKAGTPFRIQTYLRMIGQHLLYDYILELNQNQLNYLANQERILREERKKFKIAN